MTKTIEADICAVKDVAEFEDWLRNDKVAVAIYYVGNLAFDRDAPTANRKDALAAADYAMELYERGRVELTRRRVDNEDEIIFVYMATRKKPKFRVVGGQKVLIPFD